MRWPEISIHNQKLGRAAFTLVGKSLRQARLCHVARREAKARQEQLTVLRNAIIL